jgi:PKHD-type hydroxylase
MYKKYIKATSRLYIPNTQSDGKDHEDIPCMFFDSFFNDEECSLIISEAEKLISKKGTTFGGANAKLRNSDVSWIPDSTPLRWVFDRVMDSAYKSNVWHYDIFGMIDGFQYTQYSGSDRDPAFYTWHKDTGPNNQHRKISFVALLSDPDDFEGGKLQLKTSKLDNVLTKKGQAIMFPSFVNHQVTPVTKGTRKSLVSWISGPKLR